MLSVSSGYSVKYLTGPVAGGREGYYTSAIVDTGEPPGLWYGAGAALLGLRGEVDAERMESVYTHLIDPRDPAAVSRSTWADAATLGKPHKNYQAADEVYEDLLEQNPGAGPERRAELRVEAERAARQAVAFIDCTFSVQKSISVLGVAFERKANQARAAGDRQAAEAWQAQHKAVEDAVLAGARAAMDYLQEHAGYARVGHHGGKAGQWADAHQWVVAQFLQHDSRDRDPQLHVHNAILNRQLCVDGEWRALDTQAIKLHKPAAAAIGERVTEAYLERAYGIRFATRPDGMAREVVGVPEVAIDLTSTRRRTIAPRAEKLIHEYGQRIGREPTSLERHQIAQSVTLATRKAKSHETEDPQARAERWERTISAKLDGGLGKVADLVLAAAQRGDTADTWSVEDVVLRAVELARQGRQSFSRAELVRRISDALPGHLGIDPERIPELLTSLTDCAEARVVALQGEERVDDLPDDWKLANGASSFARPGSTLFAAPEQLAAEQRLRQAAVRRGAVAFSADEAEEILARFAASDCKLGVDQAAAVRGVMTSGAYVEVLSAAAGTGKSFVVGAVADAWRESDRRAFGLAASEVATQNLVEEGLTARNIARWLGTQRRLDEHEAGAADPGDDERWRLRSGDLLVVDEAGMADTTALLEIQRRCDEAGVKLLLTGDPHQLAAVGPGGTLADLSEHGVRYELSEVRRFDNDWEAAASLRLRAGDASVIDEYDQHGRILSGGTTEDTETAVTRGWLADRLSGRETLALVPTNEAAARLNSALRAELVQLGLVDEQGVPLATEGTTAGVGDLVQARSNAWHLIGVDGNTSAPINRRCYTVRAVREDGALVVEEPPTAHCHGHQRPGRHLTLPSTYVAEHLTLGYASTVHAAQGRTVDTCHALISRASDRAAAYVGLTRGRRRNTAYCVTQERPEDSATGADPLVVAEDGAVVADVAGEERTGRAVLADLMERDERGDPAGELSASAFAEQAAEDAASVQTSIERLAQRMTMVNAARVTDMLDQFAVDGTLEPHQRSLLAADQSIGAVQQILRTAELAGHDPEEVLRTAIEKRSFDGSRSLSQVLHGRIADELTTRDMTSKVTSYADLVPSEVPEDSRAYLQRLANDADERRRELGTRLAEDPPQWAIEALGAVPRDVMGREEWEHAAGWAAAYRELTDHADENDAIGAAPPAGLAEQNTAWRAAYEALHLSEPSTDEADMREGRLRLHVHAFEREVQWAPKWVGDELAATSEAAEQARVTAELSAARATAATDEAERERLRDEAQAAVEQADELAERVEALELANTARAEWFANTAPTREAAARARDQLGLRGIALDDPDELVTAEEWLAEHRAAQRAEEAVRVEVDEAELVDQHRDQQSAVAEDVGPVLETEIPDVRESSTRDATEDADPAERRRVPTADETAETVARAQAALAEIKARREADAAREAEDARRDQLTRWAEQDRAEAREAEHADEPALEG